MPNLLNLYNLITNLFCLYAALKIPCFRLTKLMADNKTDVLLFDAIKAGDEKAFKVLFLKYYAHLCRYASRFLKDDAVIEELVSDLLLHVWSDRKKITITHELKHYLLLAVKNR